MGKITTALKGFLAVTMGVVIAGAIAFMSVATYEKGEATYKRVREFRGAVSRTMGGDWEQTRDDWALPDKSEVSVADLTDEDLDKLSDMAMDERAKRWELEQRRKKKN